jgi:hypothetical protein
MYKFFRLQKYDFFEYYLFVCKLKKFLYFCRRLHGDEFPGLEILRGNQVKILNSTRCCKFYTFFAHIFLVTVEQFDGKARKEKQVRKPAI